MVWNGSPVPTLLTIIKLLLSIGKGPNFSKSVDAITDMSAPVSAKAINGQLLSESVTKTRGPITLPLILKVLCKYEGILLSKFSSRVNVLNSGECLVCPHLWKADNSYLYCDQFSYSNYIHSPCYLPFS